MSALAGELTFARLARLGASPPRCTRVTLRQGRLRRAVPMELRVTPWRADERRLSLVELVPRRRVAPTQAYFDAGNRLLDALVEGS